jgi:hypothetical protein
MKFYWLIWSFSKFSFFFCVEWNPQKMEGINIVYLLWNCDQFFNQKKWVSYHLSYEM